MERKGVSRSKDYFWTEAWRRCKIVARTTLHVEAVGAASIEEGADIERAERGILKRLGGAEARTGSDTARLEEELLRGMC